MAQSVTPPQLLVSDYGVSSSMVHLRQLGDRIDVIETALSVALQQPEPENRGRMLNALESATAAVRAEQQEAEASRRKGKRSFRVIPGRAAHRGVSPRSRPADGGSSERSPGRTPDRVARSAG